VRAFFGRFSTHPFWDNHMLSVSRLVDWLTLLDISVQRVDYACFQLPFNKPILTRFFSRLERALTARGLAFSAGIYVVAAKNEYIPVTPIKPRWPLVRAELSSAAENGYCNDSLKVECDKQNKTDTGMI
ncbi:MAG: hypothetical protein KAG18_03400, partial [Sinobacterium sp.]|nr:hypothetical protein [Sinobacterium sp.]